MSRNILILTPEKDPYTTTFIKAHFEHLSGNKKHLYGVFFPTRSVDDSKYMRQSLFQKAVGRSANLFLGRSKNFRQEQALAKYLDKNKIDLVLAEFGPVGAEVAATCRRSKVPLVVHFHGFDATAFNILKKYKEQYSKMFDYAAAIVVVSKDMEQHILALGAPSEKVIYNCYGPSDEFLPLQSDFSKRHFVAVGRFVDKKAPYLTLAAFKNVLQKYSDASLTMAGDGPLLFACKNLAKSWKITNNVNFTGAISHEETRKLYNTAYCFLQHSIVAENGDSEGTPLGILEAQAAGLPVVSTKHAGIKDVVIHGKTGYLVDEGDTEKMAEYMIALASDFTLAKEMGASGKSRIKEHFSLKKHIDTLNKIIEKSIDENRK